MRMHCVICNSIKSSAGSTGQGKRAKIYDLYIRKGKKNSGENNWQTTNVGAKLTKLQGDGGMGRLKVPWQSWKAERPYPVTLCCGCVNKTPSYINSRSIFSLLPLVCDVSSWPAAQQDSWAAQSLPLQYLGTALSCRLSEMAEYLLHTIFQRGYLRQGAINTLLFPVYLRDKKWVAKFTDRAQALLACGLFIFI